MKTSVTAGIIVLILAIAAIGGYYYKTQNPSKTVLVVGTNIPFPPLEYEENGVVTGFDIEIIRALAQRAGYKDIQIKVMTFESLMTNLQQGKIDVVAAGMTRTPERAEKVAFTQSYLQANQSILVRQDTFNPHGMEDLSGMEIGVQNGTTGETLADEYKATLKEIRRYDSFLLAVLDLQNGRIEAVIVDSPSAMYYSKQYPVKVASTITTGEEYCFAVRKEDTTLLASLNEALQEFKGSPEWNALVDKYFG